MAEPHKATTRIICAGLCLLFLVLAGGFWLNGCAKRQEPLLRVASNVWSGYETLYLARSLGYYEDKNIRLVELPSNSQVSQSLRNGVIEAACLTLDEALSLLQDGVDLRVVLVMDFSHGADVVMARPGIDTLQALRGKRIGVETAAVGATMLDAALQAGELQAEDVTIVPLTVDGHADAYRAGRIDAVVTFEPVRSRLLQEGARVLFDSAQVPGRIVDVLAVRPEVAAAHAKALGALLKGHFRAREYLAGQPQDAAKRMAPRLGENALEQFVGLRLPGIQENQALLGGNPPGLKSIAGELAALMLRRKLLHKEVSVERLADPSFLVGEKK
ncbi:MAG: ABC transporter substrate-binding protein [Proteobacteria bacterium]|nr:ABC transporter substrate-binding protein [Pseudomonadota bacterium]MBU1547803.1 ABC transporter substrate-binding protein [Pseudomonadota bacterium]MBU2618564.1 ABC transporter substrate-binding protein [Pseudomonadota bacterium]